MKKRKKKVFIIAEAGCNHNGKISIAKKLIDIASKAKADAIKFQTFNVDELVTKNAPKAKYALEHTEKFETQYEMQKRLQLSFKDHVKLKVYCKKKKIEFISSTFDILSTEILKKLQVRTIKIPSGEINNLPNLKRIGSLGKKIILSTGMSSINDIRVAIKILEKAGTNKKNIVLLHCTTDYPAKIGDVNLLAMNEIRNKFKMEVGYSDHTLGIDISLAAVALGASVIEKHITLDRKMKGPDHYASLEENEFNKLVKSIRNLELALGDGKKKPKKNELKNLYAVRKSIKARKNIEKGQLFSENNLLVARPGKGLSPLKWEEVIGRKARKNFKIGQDIKL